MSSVTTGSITYVGIPNTPCLRILIKSDEATWDDGYESDRKKGLQKYDVIEKGKQDFNEEMIRDTPFPYAAATG